MRSILKRVSFLAIPSIVSSGLLATIATVYPTALWAQLAFVLFCLFCLAMAKLCGTSFIAFSPILALRFTEMVSGMAIENGAYMEETGVFGEPTGAFSRLLVIYILFFSIGALTCETLAFRILRHPSPNVPQLRLLWWVIGGITCASLLYLLYVGITAGFPLLTNVDRFQFLNSQSRIYRSIIQNRLLIIPLLGYLATTPSYRMKSLLLLLLIAAVSILFAEKFTSLLLMLTLFCMPAGVLAVEAIGNIRIRWILMAGTCITIVTIPTVLLVYGASDDFDGAVERYGRRAAVQGQLWYVIDDPDVYWRGPNWRVLSDDMSSWFSPGKQDAQTAGLSFGLYYVMAQHAETDILRAAMDYGGGFVFCLYPYLLMASGITGVMLVSTVLAILHAVIVVFLLRALETNNWLGAFIFTKCFSNLIAIYIVGYLWFAFGIKNIAMLAAGFGLTLSYHLLINGRTNLEKSRNARHDS